ncbi:MAG: hypothetical protein JNM31_14905 [Flavobacteriales bacterium]|nr:hypothetical protein [Flavobacteriales bacterium]
MKKQVARSILITALVFGLAGTAVAQQLHLNVFGGYTFRERVDISGTYNGLRYNRVFMEHSEHFGGSLEFEFRPGVAIDLRYQLQPTTGWADHGVSRTTFDLDVHYITLGVLRYREFSDVASGFGGIMIGAGVFDSDKFSTTNFSIGFQAGILAKFSEAVGLKIGAQLMSPVQGAGAGLFFGTGGASVGVSTFSTVFQFGFTGGLRFSFGGTGGTSSSAPPRMR